jgi:hypothetical protein
MTLTSPPTAVAPFEKGRLAAGISASATTITVSPIYKTVNGVRTKQGFNSTSGIAIISHGDFTERISFEGASVDATTKLTSLTTCVRGLSATSTTASFAGGTGRIWPKGAKITLVADVAYFQSGVFTNVANTFTALQTFPQGINVSGKYVQLPVFADATARDVAIASPSNGMMVYNTGTGTIQQYIAGAWTDVGDTGTANASTTVAGKAEEAVLSEVSAGTAAGGTGARLFINPSLVKKSSSGAAEGNIVALNASTVVDPSIGGTGRATLTANSVLLGDGTSPVQLIAPSTSGNLLTSNGTTWQSSVPAVQNADVRSVSTTDSAVVGASVSTENDMATNYSITANDWAVGAVYKFVFHVVHVIASGNLTFKLKLGSTALYTFGTITTTGTQSTNVEGYIVCRSTGGSGTVHVVGRRESVAVLETMNTATGAIAGSTTTIDTTATLALQMSAQFSATDASQGAAVASLIVTKLTV